MQQDLDPDLALDWHSAPRPDGGVLYRDLPTRREAARDLGGIVHALPGAVLRPAGGRDIAHLLSWASLRGVPASAAGTRHQMGGQASPGEGGLIIDTRSLSEIYDLQDDHITVGAGTTLRQITEAASARGLRTISGSTGYTRLTVGGVCSAGGITSTYRTGALIDSVEELEVVTAAGEIHTCTAEDNAELFNAALAGGGRGGIITRVRLALTHAPSRVRTWTLHYTQDPEQTRVMLADMRMLADRGEVDELWVQWLRDEQVDHTTYRMHVSSYYTGPEPDPQVLLQDLHREPAEVTDETWGAHAIRHDALYDTIMPEWAARPKAWSCYFLPESELAQWCDRTAAELDETDYGTPLSQGLMFPHKRTAFARPGLHLPEPTGDPNELVVLWGVLLETSNDTPAEQWLPPRMGRARRWVDHLHTLGGTVYPIGSDPVTPDDAPTTDSTDDLMATHDPHQILSGPYAGRVATHLARRHN
ncbi:FAD-binding protein [Saccharopolyspora griseoalba]|uniref:FAD-binding protein n=1 Tax=Saccharopolyspora griseoalba TaxID=1431848 RepID=A0ABW2LPV6_9PSEU